jgi:hypothetical protein
VPITAQLASRLREAAKGRAADAPLLTQMDGSAWGDNPGQRYHRHIDKIVTEIGLDPTVMTIYRLRHSSVVRQLLLGVPIRLTASTHNTSVAMIERTYSKASPSTVTTSRAARCCSMSNRAARMSWCWRADHGPEANDRGICKIPGQHHD